MKKFSLNGRWCYRSRAPRRKLRRKMYIRRARREQSYHQLIRNHIFRDYIYNDDLEGTIASIQKYRRVLEKYLEILRRDIVTSGWDPDLRRGTETYGYESRESIEADLSYISDRFGCEFRIQWMLDLPEEFSKLTHEPAPSK